MMKVLCVFLLVISSLSNVLCHFSDTLLYDNVEEKRNNLLCELICHNLKNNGWNNLLLSGWLPDTFYQKLQNIPYTRVITVVDHEDYEIDDIVPYHSNVVILSCVDFDEYEQSIQKLTTSPYWHPLAHVILYIHDQNNDIIPKALFSFWYYRAINALIIHYDDTQQKLLITNYTPYVVDSTSYDKYVGCWTTRKIGLMYSSFKDGFTCTNTCQNVTLQSRLRENNLGTCIGYSTISVPYSSPEAMKTMKLFKDKTKNFNGFTLRAFTSKSKPFLIVNENENGTFTLASRDGTMWNTMAELMNFTLDISPNRETLKKGFNFELTINQIFGFAHRKADVYLLPIYLFDIIVVDVDMSYPYRQSGVCFMSHRASFQTSLFGASVIRGNFTNTIQFIVCFFFIWFTYVIFNRADKPLTLDQIGKDLMNAVRNVLLISIHKPPRRQSFRIFLTASIWSFFVLNFIIQATVTSLFTAAKRGKEVNTFDDVIEKGYIIEGMASPDLILPDTEEKFRIINSRLAPVFDLFECVNKLSYDSQRFCLIDCSVGHYTMRNKLNKEGEQYLHLSTDKIHSHYLTIIHSKHSPITERFDKYLAMFIEAGLINKWEQYRFNDIKDDVPTKPLDFNDLKGLFDMYCFCVGFTCIVFFIELTVYHTIRVTKTRRNVG